MRHTLFGVICALVISAQPLLVQGQTTVEMPRSNRYFISAQSVTINEDITGDVYALAPLVTVNGTVSGDLLVLSGKLTINGTVHGDVRAMSQNIEVTGQVQGNVTTVGQVVYIRDTARVKGSVSGLATKMNVIGPVEHNLEGRYRNLLIASDVEGDVDVTVTNRFNRALIILATARLGGNLEYRADREADIQPGAKIVGRQNWRLLHSYGGQELLYQWQEPTWWLVRFAWILSLWLAGLLALKIGRRFVWSIIERMRLQPRSAIWHGLIMVVLGFLALMTLALSLVGLPLAVMGTGLYIFLLGSGLIWSALYIGIMFKAWVLRQMEISDATLMLIGSVLYVILLSWPYVGAYVAFISLIFACGAWWLAFKIQMKR